MFVLLVAGVCLALTPPLHRLLETTMPRRFGTLRPRLVWLTGGVVSLGFFAVSGLLFTASPSLFALRFSAFCFGIGSIAYFAHRRVYFRRNGAYEFRFGLPVRACRFASVSHCEAGQDIIREGLILRLRSGKGWGVPGLMPGSQITEALVRLREAGLALPDEDDLRKRLGIGLPKLLDRRPSGRSA